MGGTVGRRAEAGLVHTATWVGGGCAVTAAAGGFLIGCVYTLDQGDPVFAILFGVIGLIVGAALGIINAMAPVFALTVTDGWPWAGATSIRALLAAVAAAVPVSAINLLLTEEPSLAFAGFCAALTALPAGIATCCMDLRNASLSRRGHTQAAVS